MPLLYKMFLILWLWTRRIAGLKLLTLYVEWFDSDCDVEQMYYFHHLLYDEDPTTQTGSDVESFGFCKSLTQNGWFSEYLLQIDCFLILWLSDVNDFHTIWPLLQEFLKLQSTAAVLVAPNGTGLEQTSLTHEHKEHLMLLSQSVSQSE